MELATIDYWEINDGEQLALSFYEDETEEGKCEAIILDRSNAIKMCLDILNMLGYEKNEKLA